jgi:hypothetical protein
MPDGLLTVSDVEHIQLALDNGRLVDAFIRGLQRATLPAVVEYGCLRWSFPEAALPNLPPAVYSSDLGQALGEVSSTLGIRTSGSDNRTWDRLDPRAYGFFVLSGEEQLDEVNWKRFEATYDASSRRGGFSPKVASQLSVALHEMAANALTHAAAPIPILVGFQTGSGRSLFCVADVGVGVLRSLKRHPNYREIDEHHDAIRLALHDGESSVNPGERGFGFREVFKALLSCDGVLRFRSGAGGIQMSGVDLDADRGTAWFPPALPGFQVTVCCRIRPPRTG